MHVILFIIALSLAALLTVTAFAAPRLRRRAFVTKALETPFPDRWREILRRDAPVYGRLSDVEREHLEANVRIFLATKQAAPSVMTRDEYGKLGVPFDQRVLEAATSNARFNFHLLHLHGDDVFFDLADELPVHAVNWHDRRTAATSAIGPL